MGLFQEFKAFVLRGNVLDMAVGIIIGAAFGKIVSSLVADVFTPLIGVIAGGDNFGGFNVVLQEAQEKTPAIVLEYGRFLNSVIDFAIVAFAIFLIVKVVNTAQRKLEFVKSAAPAPPAAPPRSEVLLGEIRDLLRARN